MRSIELKCSLLVLLFVLFTFHAKPGTFHQNGTHTKVLSGGPACTTGNCYNPSANAGDADNTTMELSFINSIRRAVNGRKAFTILLRSSWNDMNIGDIGHTPGTLRLLQRYLPEADILLWHAQPRPVTEAIVTKNFPQVKIIRGDLIREDHQVNAKVKQAFDQADVYVHNSGMSFNFGLFNYEPATIVNNLTPFQYCIDNHIPFGLYGQSFDKFDPPALSFYRSVFNHAAFIYCRDKESLQFLKENRFTAPVLEFAPDGCFGIDVRDEEKGLSYVKEKGLEDNQFLVVVIRSNTPHPYARGKSDRLNPESTPELKKEDSLRMVKVIALIDHWVRTTGLKVLLAPEAFKEIEAARSMVFDRLPPGIQQKVVWRDTFWSADEAMSVYARARVLFGMEPHSLIMGLALGKPIIHARSIKNGRKGWMFRDIGLDDWLFDIDETPAKTLTGAVMQIHEQYSQALKKASGAMRLVSDAQKRSIGTVGGRKNT